MDAPLDLFGASREDLVTVIVRLREQSAAQDQEITRLRAEVDRQRAVTPQLQERIGTLLVLLDAPGDDPPARPTTMPGLQPVDRHCPAGAPPAPRKHRARLVWAAADGADGAP